MTRKSSRKARQLKTISLFTGAGGMDYGFEAAGFETVAAVEMDHDACETLRSNRTFPVIEKKLETIPTSELLSASGMRAGEVDLLIGGPPCQPFSKSAYWSRGDTKRLEDPRANTLWEYMRCVEETQPTVFVLENVYGLGYEGKSEGIDLLVRLTDEINKRVGTHYRINKRLINTAEYGVPQIRERFFLVAHRDGKTFHFPDPTHRRPDAAESDPDLFGSSLLDPTTSWDAIGDMTIDDSEDLAVRGQWADLLPSIPEGENYLWHTKRKGGMPLFGWRSRYWSFLLKLAKNKPSWTIQAQPGPAIGPFHWDNRRLSIAEMAAIQTFPRGLRFVGSRVSLQKQIGNAVPSLVTEVLGREIRRQLFGEEIKEPLKLAVQIKRPIPPPERVKAVRKKFLHLLGDHPNYDDLRKEARKLKSQETDLPEDELRAVGT
jgi:DNA (cytosine-5)-methyltransferase 1